MPRLASTFLSLVAGAVAAVALPAQPPKPPKLGTVLRAFLADSGVQTRGLAWTSGAALPVKWETKAPVAGKSPYFSSPGLTHMRNGKLTVALDSGAPVRAEIHIAGTATGIQRLSIGFPFEPNTSLPLELVDRTLATDGFTLTPIKCKRETEGETYGNLVKVAKAPGKTASGLHQSWNCGHDACGFGLSILYRRADVASVECASS